MKALLVLAVCFTVCRTGLADEDAVVKILHRRPVETTLIEVQDLSAEAATLIKEKIQSLEERNKNYRILIKIHGISSPQQVSALSGIKVNALGLNEVKIPAGLLGDLPTTQKLTLRNVRLPDQFTFSAKLNSLILSDVSFDEESGKFYGSVLAEFPPIEVRHLEVDGKTLKHDIGNLKNFKATERVFVRNNVFDSIDQLTEFLKQHGSSKEILLQSCSIKANHGFHQSSKLTQSLIPEEFQNVTVTNPN